MKSTTQKQGKQDDARAKIKIAADMYPIKFIAVMKRSKKEGGGWVFEEF